MPAMEAVVMKQPVGLNQWDIADVGTALVVIEQSRRIVFRIKRKTQRNEMMQQQTFTLLQLLLRRMTQPQMRFDIIPEALVPIPLLHAVVEIREIRDPRPSRVGNHDVQPSELRDGFLHETLDFLPGTDVRLDGGETGLGGFAGGGGGDGVQFVEEGRGAGGVVGVVYYLRRVIRVDLLWGFRGLVGVVLTMRWSGARALATWAPSPAVPAVMRATFWSAMVVVYVVTTYGNQCCRREEVVRCSRLVYGGFVVPCCRGGVNGFISTSSAVGGCPLWILLLYTLKNITCISVLLQNAF